MVATAKGGKTEPRQKGKNKKTEIHQYRKMRRSDALIVRWEAVVQTEVRKWRRGDVTVSSHRGWRRLKSPRRRKELGNWQTREIKSS